MTRVFILISSLALVCAEQSSLGAGMSSMLEQLSNVQILGKSRAAGVASGQKVGVEMLLQRISRADPTAEKLNETMTAVTNLIDDLITHLKQSLEYDQKLLNDFRDNIETCYDALEREEVKGKLVISQTNKADHQTCREEEGDAHDNRNDECSPIAGFELKCTENQGDAPDEGVSPYTAWADHWVQVLSDNEAYYSTGWTIALSHNTSCRDNINAHETKKDQCDDNQTTYESSYCVHLNAHNNMCNKQATCETNKGKIFLDENVTLQGDAVARRNDVKILLWIQCITRAFTVAPLKQPTEYDLAQIGKDCNASENFVNIPTEYALNGSNIPVLEPCVPLTLSISYTSNPKAPIRNTITDDCQE